MLERIMKAVKSGNKKRGRNITIGTIVGMLLSCTVVMGVEIIGLEITKDNSDNIKFTALSGGEGSKISIGEDSNEYYNHNIFKDNVYTNNMRIEGGSSYYNTYGMKLSSLTDNFILINENVITGRNTGKEQNSIGENSIGINIENSNIEFAIKNNGIISSEKGRLVTTGIKIDANIKKTTIENEGIISAKTDSPSKSLAKGIENDGKNMEIVNLGIIYGDAYEKEGIGITNKGSNFKLENSGIIYGNSNVKSQNIMGVAHTGKNGEIKNIGMIFETSSGNNMSHGVSIKDLDILKNDGIIYSIKKSPGNISSGVTYNYSSNSIEQKILNNGIIFGINNGTNNEKLSGYGIYNQKGNIYNLLNKGIIFGNEYAIKNSDFYSNSGEIGSGANYGLLVSGGDRVTENITFAGTENNIVKDDNNNKNIITNYGLVFTVDEDRVYTSKDEYKNSFGTEKKLTVEGTEYTVANVGATLAEDGNGKIESYDSFKLESEDKQYDKYILNGIEKTLVVKGTGNTVSSSVINGYDEAVEMEASSGLTLKDTKVNSYGTAITMAGNSELTLENSIANGGALGAKEDLTKELPTINISGDSNKLILEKNSIVNGNYKDKEIENLSPIIKVEGSNNAITIHGGSVVNGKMESSGDNNTLNFFGNSENMRAAGTGKINVLHDISGFDNIGIKGNVTLFEGMSVSGASSITIAENSALNLRLSNTSSGNLDDAEFDEDKELIFRPTHALENNGEKLTITGEGNDKNTVGKINFVTDNIGKRVKLNMKDIYIKNLHIKASSAIDSARFEEGKELVLSAGTSLEDLHLDKIYNSDASGNPDNPKPEKPSKKRYNSLNNIYKGIYGSTDGNLNALRVLIASDDLGNNYDENMRDEEQLKNLMRYLNSVYTETPYSFSSELSRRSAGMFRDIVTENEFRPNLNNWLIMGGLTHADDGTKDTYYGRNYHGVDTGTSDTDADMKLTGAYMLAKYGYSENTSLGLTLGGNKSEAKLDMSKVKGNSGYLGAFAENYRGNLTLKAGAGVQYSEYDADRRTMGGHSYSDKYSDMTYDIYLNGRYSHNIGKDLFLEPYATLSYTYVDQDGANEGSKALAIETDSKSFDYTVVKAGVDLKKVIPHEKGKSTVSAGVSYTRIFDGADEEYITGKFEGGSDFDILVAHKNEHSIGLNAKYALELENGVIFDVKGTYSVERDSHNQSGKNRTKGEWIVGAGIGYKF